ncbi:MAG TPA: trimeric intracellular cation channel family protein [Planctomycetota bacterium]|nr:trimeric intracellular cation channel family protein [Planctomycetota bacterium]HRR78668.1 trimeric intracellular cation channel family protein [Planctomycetota bacterium]HRT96979.1 trimeric intracellular cation channel family protein [Planctomycetota bacterium]
MTTIQFLDYLGTLAFAVSGALKGVRKEMDIFGVAVLATVTAIGGGTIRDTLLKADVFWLRDPVYVPLAVAAAIGVFVLYHWVQRGRWELLIADAVGLGVFAAIGAVKAWDAGTGLVGVVTMACLTGVGGGIIRDVLARDVPAVLREEVYASATMAGAFLFYVLMRAGAGQGVAVWAAACLTLAVRLASIALRWHLPRRIVDENEP